MSAPPAAAADPKPEILQLAEDIVACRQCQAAGYLERATPIRPEGSGRERILLIGQAPGPVTDAKGYHFAGPAGRVLDTWFQRAGFAPGEWRRVMYLSSLTRCFPGKAFSGSGDRPPSRQEMHFCRAYLDREIATLDPALVVLVGKMAIDAFLGKAPLTETVGRLYERDGRLFLPLPHASGVSRWLNDAANKALLEQALNELARLRPTLLGEPTATT